jgi:hypothetical protein
MTIAATITAVMALGVAAFTLSMLIATRRASRVIVTAAVVQADDLTWRLRLDVSNTGVTPVRVHAIWLWVSTRRTARPDPVGFFGKQHGSPMAVTDPEPPTRIDSCDWRTWETPLLASYELTDSLPANTRAYLAVYLSFGVMVSTPVPLLERKTNP